MCAMSPRLLRPLASGFNPRTIAGLEAWWDASDANNVTLDSGRVAALLDKSGKGRHAENSSSGSTQPDYVTGAVNGRNVARCVAADIQRLEVPSSTATFNFLHNGTPSYIAMVASAGTTSNPDDLFSFMGNIGGVSSSNTGFLLNYDDRVAFSNDDRFGAFVVGGSAGTFMVRTALLSEYNGIFPGGTPNLVEVALDAGNATAADRLGVRINGGAEVATNTASGTPSTGNATLDFAIGTAGGAGQPLTGDICEILVFSQQPSSGQRAALRRYMASKWGIALA